MTENTDEYFRYPAGDPRDERWGLSVTGAGFQPVRAGAEAIPRRPHPPGHFYAWHQGRILSEFAAIYVARGRGEFESTGTGSISLLPGDAAIVLPGIWHRYRPDQDVGWAIYWVHFLGPLPNRLLQDGVFAANRAVVNHGPDDAIVDAFRGLLDALRSDTAGAVAAAKTTEILARLSASPPPQGGGSRLQQIVRRARLMLEEEPDGLPVIDDIIKGFAISRTHFFRAFKRETGHSPYDYHLQISIRRAGEMLRNSKLSVRQIADVLGFRDPYHFSRLFKRKAGISPRGYRERWQNAPSRTRT